METQDIGTTVSAVISSVQDWFGLLALIIIVFAAMIYWLMKSADTKTKLIVFMVSVFAFIPLLYIFILKEPHPDTAKASNHTAQAVPGTLPESHNQTQIPKRQQNRLLGCGEVYNLLPMTGDGFLAVRTHPSTQEGERIDKLFNGDRVAIHQVVGDWVENSHIAHNGAHVKGWSHKRWIKDSPCPTTPQSPSVHTVKSSEKAPHTVVERDLNVHGNATFN